MYKIIVCFDSINNTGIQTKVYSFRTERAAKANIPLVRDKLLSTGYKITSLKLYKTEEIPFQ